MDLRRNEKLKGELKRIKLFGKLDAVIFPYKSSDFFFNAQFLNAQCVSTEEVNRFSNTVQRRRELEYI